MVPLQDLMQDDAVEKAAQTQPEQNPARIGKPAPSSVFIRPLPEAARGRKQPPWLVSEIR